MGSDAWQERWEVKFIFRRNVAIEGMSLKDEPGERS